MKWNRTFIWLLLLLLFCWLCLFHGAFFIVCITIAIARVAIRKRKYGRGQIANKIFMSLSCVRFYARLLVYMCIEGMWLSISLYGCVWMCVCVCLVAISPNCSCKRIKYTIFLSHIRHTATACLYPSVDPFKILGNDHFQTTTPGTTHKHIHTYKQPTPTIG